MFRSRYRKGIPFDMVLTCNNSRSVTITGPWSENVPYLSDQGQTPTIAKSLIVFTQVMPQVRDRPSNRVPNSP